MQRLDIVWDVYLENSLKKQAREKRGQTSNVICALDDTKIPGNWNAFKSSDTNKGQLAVYLADRLLTRCTRLAARTTLVSTRGENVIIDGPSNHSRHVAPCNQEEADTRLFLHAMEAAREGLSKLMVKTVDTDVVVIAISVYRRLGVEELWVEFGAGMHHRFIPVHEIASTLGEDRCRALPGFHSFTGCDQVSSFAYKSKTTAWHCWNAFDEVTSAFRALSTPMNKAQLMNHIPTLERFVVLLYDRTCPESSVDLAGRYLYCHKKDPLKISLQRQMLSVYILSAPPISAAMNGDSA